MLNVDPRSFPRRERRSPFAQLVGRFQAIDAAQRRSPEASQAERHVASPFLDEVIGPGQEDVEVGEAPIAPAPNDQPDLAEGPCAAELHDEQHGPEPVQNAFNAEEAQGPEQDLSARAAQRRRRRRAMVEHPMSGVDEGSRGLVRRSAAGGFEIQFRRGVGNHITVTYNITAQDADGLAAALAEREGCPVALPDVPQRMSSFPNVESLVMWLTMQSGVRHSMRIEHG